MEPSTFAAFEQRQKEEESRDARRRARTEAAEGEAEGAAEVAAEEPAQQTMRRETPRVGRNEPCHCGSGKKFKKCHGA